MIKSFYYRLKHKFIKELKRRSWNTVPYQKSVTFVEEGANWYEPILVGPSTFVEDCTSAKTVVAVLDIIKNLTMDKFIEFNLEYYKAGVERFGDNWRYADINTVLYGICKNISVKDYMEIGVRRGRSMSIVAKLHPKAHLVGFDMWIPNYVGIKNPGPDYVKNEMTKLGYIGDIEFISGDSRKTVPRYFDQHPEAFFDLITVDGDHSVKGAKIDLKNVIPRLKIGGLLVFDDICNPYHTYLKKVWYDVVEKSDRFIAYSFTELGYGVAFAVKKY